MRFFHFLCFAAPLLLQGQTTAPPAASTVTPDTVVATTDGKKLTAGDVQKLVASLPPQMRQNYDRDPRGFLSQYFMLKRVVAFAEERKLQDRSPYKEGIEFARMQVLWQAALEEQSREVVVSAGDEKKYYEERKGDYTQARVKLVYIPFIAGKAVPVDASKKTMTEAEALAKAETVVKEARGGKDFVALVKANSEDPISKEKDGDFGPVKRTDRLPDPIKNAIFQLKPGEVSDPIRQPNGYYVIRLIELVPQPFEEVRSAIHVELKNQRVKQWIETSAKATQLQVEKADFFASPRK
ncbi:MAG: peptidyl-prolyl cis-trans isomerase [Bryobacterales bacterium]|nr:peptidyl-prolyl cis-trans isomerase [Bryobacterales bacterium]